MKNSLRFVKFKTIIVIVCYTSLNINFSNFFFEMKSFETSWKLSFYNTSFVMATIYDEFERVKEEKKGT